MLSWLENKKRFYNIRPRTFFFYTVMLAYFDRNFYVYLVLKSFPTHLWSHMTLLYVIDILPQDIESQWKRGKHHEEQFSLLFAGRCLSFLCKCLASPRKLYGAKNLLFDLYFRAMKLGYLKKVALMLLDLEKIYHYSVPCENADQPAHVHWLIWDFSKLNMVIQLSKLPFKCLLFALSTSDA